MPMCLEITADFVCVRFHGLEGGAAHNYTDRELRRWAKFLRGCAKEGLTGFLYFNNDMNTRAPLNALRLMQLVGSLAVQACHIQNLKKRVEKSEGHLNPIIGILARDGEPSPSRFSIEVSLVA